VKDAFAVGGKKKVSPQKGGGLRSGKETLAFLTAGWGKNRGCRLPLAEGEDSGTRGSAFDPRRLRRAFAWCIAFKNGKGMEYCR